MTTLELTVNVSQIAGSLALVVSVLLLFRELRHSNKLTRAANTQSLVALSSPFQLGLIQDRRMAELYVKGAVDFEAMDGTDQHLYRSLLLWWLIFHENVYHQWRQGLLDDRSYDAWQKDLRVFVHLQRLETQWETLRSLLQDEFAEYVGRLLASPPRP